MRLSNQYLKRCHALAFFIIALHSESYPAHQSDASATLAPARRRLSAPNAPRPLILPNRFRNFTMRPRKRKLAARAYRLELRVSLFKTNQAPFSHLAGGFATCHARQLLPRSRYSIPLYICKHGHIKWATARLSRARTWTGDDRETVLLSSDNDRDALQPSL